MNIAVIIPARYESTRFPGKPLALIQGKSMIRRVVEQAHKAKDIYKVVVATDDARIYDHVKGFGGDVILTGTHHLNGTSRCFEAMTILQSTGQPLDAVINVQGDEPMIQPEQIEKLAQQIMQPKTGIATLIKKITTTEELFSQHVVKVVVSSENKALYFSRQAIPYLRGVEHERWLDHHSFYKHIGIYAYKCDILKQIIGIPAGNLEQAESLEQLRWLENDLTIHTQITEFESIGIDTPEDLKKLTNNF